MQSVYSTVRDDWATNKACPTAFTDGVCIKWNINLIWPQFAVSIFKNDNHYDISFQEVTISRWLWFKKDEKKHKEKLMQ